MPLGGEFTIETVGGYYRVLKEGPTCWKVESFLLRHI